jgi:NAD(P)H-hydrate epimerase
VVPRHFLITAKLVQSYLAPRPADAHKGIAGHLLVIAGSTGKTGAASMTSMSALRAGAGLVTLGVAESLNDAIEGQMPEAMTAPLPECHNGILGESALNTIRKVLRGKRCLAIGPGLGLAAETRDLIHKIMRECQLPLVIDADGLTHLAAEVNNIKNASAPVILTPHPGEMARLLDIKVSQVQQERIKCAHNFAVDCNAHVVLKGARTVIAHPDGRVFINPSGNAGMASGGMGDVLTGIIAGLIVQGLSPEAACHAGVYLHGAAADTLAQNVGPYGYLAGDVMHSIPGEIKKVVSG